MRYFPNSGSDPVILFYNVYRGTGAYLGSQAVYDKDTGELINKGRYQGTYDRVSPNNIDGSRNLGKTTQHFGSDVVPHYVFGDDYSPTPEENIY